MKYKKEICLYIAGNIVLRRIIYTIMGFAFLSRCV